MESSDYTIDKLKALRGSRLQFSFQQKLIEEAQKNQVLASIMARPVRNKRSMHSLSRLNAEARKSSSAESENNVFVKPPGPQPAALLQNHTIRQKMAPSMAVGTQLDGQAGRQLDGQDAEPEVQAPEVLSQRPVLPDQKRKGFEQFYEAVRSPTHVRVTAGGRIVPNTLDPAHSPTGKGGKDRFPIAAESIQQPQFGQQPMLNSVPFLPGHPMLPMHPAFLMGQPGMAGAMPGAALPPSFGGQWFFPPPPMMPMPFPAPGPMLGPVMYQQTPPTPVSAGVPQASGAVPGSFHGLGMLGAPQSQTQPVHPSYLSSIRPSIITKNQLAGLRSSLKKAEAQLAYNRHQIDVRHMEEYARQLRADIQHFEVKLKGEIALETPREHSTEHRSDSSNTLQSGLPDDAKSEPVQPVMTKEHSKSSEKKVRKKDRVKLTVDTSMPFKPSLQPSAALAPVFQPRADTEAQVNAQQTAKMASMLKDNKKDTFGGRFHGPIPVNFEESSRYLSVAPPTPADDVEAFSNFARENAGLGLPYLVGEVPFGMDPSPEIRDYIYHRALTQDEEMAKHLFWTEAPDHLRRKFPKFDGKDFYPVSPEKQARPKIKVTNLPTGRPAEDYGFSLPTADLDPFAPLEPYRGDVFRTTSVSRERDMKRATKSDNVTSPMKHRSDNRLRPVAYFNSQGLDESKGSSGSSENVGETDSERAYFNSCVRAWSERVTATATALPGAVTSNHVRGLLPSYGTGNAAASLSPAIVKAARLSPSKANDGDNLSGALDRMAISADVRAENQPPNRSIQIK